MVFYKKENGAWRPGG